MKNLFIITLALAVGLAACQNGDQQSGGQGLSQEEKQEALKDSSKYTSIQWLDSTVLNLGKVKEGTVVEVSYHFKNVGKYPLIITDVTPGCGCTVPEKPEKPYAPGEEGVIKAKFNSKDQHLGEIAKTVGVSSNTNPSYVNLIFRAEIIK
jgi:hypothetical protein